MFTWIVTLSLIVLGLFVVALLVESRVLRLEMEIGRISELEKRIVKLEVSR